MDILASRRRILFFVPNLRHFETGEVRSKESPSFVAISVTGTACSLMCDHCRAGILKSMLSATSADSLKRLLTRLAAGGCTGVLITGGSSADGSVPLEPFEDAMKFAKEELGLKVAVHTGLVSKETASSLKRAKVDVAMTDIIGSPETLRRVCHLRREPSAYYESLYNLADAGVPLSPHVVVGMDYGLIRGEQKALDIIASIPVDSVVLVVLRPLQGTPMESVPLPPMHAIRELFTHARGEIARAPVLLGCMRPAGSYGRNIEAMAVDLGFDGMAYPSDGVVSYASQKGYSTDVRHVCCSMIFQEAPGNRPSFRAGLLG